MSAFLVYDVENYEYLLKPLLYTFGYNLTYILPELILTVILLAIPAVAKAIGQIKRQAAAS